MKALVFLAVVFIQTQTDWVHSENVEYNDRIKGCMVNKNPDNKILHEYNQIQIVTDLIRIPLRDVVRRPLLSENDAEHNLFLACSWQRYGYQSKHGEIIYEPIEKALREALVLEVGATGPGINLSKFEAKRIVNDCKNISAWTNGLRAVRTQNCIHRQIKHLGAP